MKKIKFSESDLGNNPFANSLEIKVRGLELSKQYKLDEDGDLLPVTIDIEYDEFCKMYSSSKKRLIRNKLPLRSKEMLMWIQDELEYGKDYLWVNKTRYMEELEIKSINTYKEALKELIRHGFITPTLASDYYWINPDFMFKGDRVKKYPKNVFKI
jgi:hypothetical protein